MSRLTELTATAGAAGGAALAALEALGRDVPAAGRALDDALSRYYRVAQAAVAGVLEPGEHQQLHDDATDAADDFLATHQRFVQAIVAMDILIESVSEMTQEIRRMRN